MEWLSKKTVPEEGSSRPKISLKRVDFPVPEGPISPINSPGLMVSEIFLRRSLFEMILLKHKRFKVMPP